MINPAEDFAYISDENHALTLDERRDIARCIEDQGAGIVTLLIENADLKRQLAEAQKDTPETEKDEPQVDTSYTGQIATLRQQLVGAKNLLSSLHALVEGECPALLDDDRGGDSALGLAIEDIIAAPPDPQSKPEQ